jgi:hypothetical protein
MESAAGQSGLIRPLPPEHLQEIGFQVEPAKEIVDWARAMFIDEDAPFCNPEHEHLRQADIAALWTNAEYKDGLYPIAGTAELVRIAGKPWMQARQTDYLCLLFGRVPEFILTFSAPLAVKANHATFCCRTEHELFHCGQKRDEEGGRKFDPDGKPVWCLRRHDVEEFVGNMERYGVDACAPASREFVEAASRPPLIPGATLDAVCGYCYGSM